MTFAWVAFHQSRHKKKKDQTLRENFNVEVDKLTRLALATGADDKEYISDDFPFKDVQIKL